MHAEGFVALRHERGSAVGVSRAACGDGIGVAEEGGGQEVDGSLRDPDPWSLVRSSVEPAEEGQEPDGRHRGVVPAALGGRREAGAETAPRLGTVFLDQPQDSSRG